MAESVQDIIIRVARELGVDPQLALATAQNESGFDPNVIGDNGHSVGLFQLNDQGEGAGMSVAARQDPETNARIALTEIASVASQHPDWTPGHIAAAAQRPANPGKYAANVNAIYGSPSDPVYSSSSSGGGSAPADATTPAPAAPALPEAPKRTLEQNLLAVNDIVGGSGQAVSSGGDSLDARLSSLNDIFGQAGFQLKGPGNG